MLGKPLNGFLASKPELCTIISKVAMIAYLIAQPNKAEYRLELVLPVFAPR
jgi:hypothetical protein